MNWSFKGCDCRRTWYIEEVDRHGLFGVDKKHRPWVEGLEIGMRIFFDDAPFRQKFDKTRHRVCGPYEVVPATIEAGTPVVALGPGGVVVVYREPHPERGPWLDQTITRTWGRRSATIRQDAKTFDYFPFRFAIRRCPEFAEALVPHGVVECRSFCEQ